LLPTEDKTRQARELLERWSKNRWSEADDGSTDPNSIEHVHETPQTKRTESPQPAFRVDEPHPGHGSTASVPRTAVPSSRPNAIAPKPALEHTFTQRTHDPHGFAVPPPHFPGEPFPEEEAPAKSSSSKLQAFWGQMLAYAGVLALTVGAAFVLLGYFGGPQWQSYTPTGWLITTTGQMLLFLGVVTLVSGGIEQSSVEVNRRMEMIGERILLIEQASRGGGLKGPSIPAERFQPGRPSRHEREVVEQQARY
jgi:uncharacterized membrane protein